MPRLWLINQFANTPDLPGHTRQFEVAAALVNLGWSVNVFASDFNLTQRKYRRLYFPFFGLARGSMGFVGLGCGSLLIDAITGNGSSTC